MLGFQLQANRLVPVIHIHVDPREFAGQQHAVVGDEVTCFFQLIHPLFQPVLRWHDIFEVVPLVDNDQRQLSEVYEPENVSFLAFEPRVL